ncbi:MAG: carboxypeptidase regulatory-like domain-containing protein [Terriglobales bacterium]
MKRRLQSLRGLSLLAAFFLVISQATWSQEVTANITGTVTDPSGAPIVGAIAVATDTERGTAFSARTNDAGVYNINRIPIGSYKVSVENPGFQKMVHSSVVLNLNQTARLDFQLKLGAVSETVEVSSEAPILQTQSTEVSTVIDATTNASLPLASRNYVQLTLLAPGSTNVNPSSMREPQNMVNSGRPYINGNREQANEFLLDGQVNNESKNDEVGYTPSIDAIQEFNLITQNASAEFGNYEGGVVSASIKSGTNQFHGNIFEFFRNDALDANNYWAGMTKGLPAFKGILGFDANGVQNKAELRYNQFGGTFGGPVVKNKLFFFADYQGQRTVNSGPTGAQLLTSNERAGDFGQLCTEFGGSFTGVGGACVGGTGVQLTNPVTKAPIAKNNLAAAGLTISPVASSLFGSKFYPLPQINTTATNNYFFKSGNSLNNDQGDLKIDYAISAKDHIFGRWSQMNLRQPQLTGLPIVASGGGANIEEPVRNAVANWTHAFTPNLLNEARLGFSGVHFTQAGTTTDVLGKFGEQIGISGANALAPGLLNIQISALGKGSPSLGNIGAVQIFHTTEGQFEDNVILTHGRHITHVGFQYIRERQNYDYGGNNGELGSLSISNLTGASEADLWLGNVGGGFRDGNTNTLFGLRGNVYGAYVQDGWRLTDTLTLNLGVRFEDHTPLYEIHDQIVNFGLTTGAIELPNQNGNNRALYNNYLGIGDWLPRLGFAWSPSALGGKTVVRGGYSISEYAEGGGANEELTQNPPFFGANESAKAGNISNGFGPSVPPCASINFSCYAGIRIRVFDPGFRPAMAQQWNLTIQHQFSNSLTGQIGYVGQHGTHLLNFMDITQLEGLNAQGSIAKPGQLIVSKVAGPFLGGGTKGSLYAADNSSLGGSNAIAGATFSNSAQRYDALQAVLKKTMTNGLEAQVAYTYSKCISNSPGYFGTGWGSTQAQSSGGQPGWQNAYDGASEFGPCYFDQKHILSSYATYQIPVGRGKAFGHDLPAGLNAVVGNWEVSGIVTLHSGNALTLNEFGGWGNFQGDPSNTNGIGSYFLSERPSCNGSLRTVNKYVPGNAATNTPGSIQWFDTSNVTDAAPNTFGTCSVGNGRGPGYANVDLGLHKQIPIGEVKRFEFRLEALNAFNHRVLNFSGGPASGSFDPGSPVFGQVTGSQGARQLQLALKFYF